MIELYDKNGKRRASLGFGLEENQPGLVFNDSEGTPMCRVPESPDAVRPGTVSKPRQTPPTPAATTAWLGFVAAADARRHMGRPIKRLLCVYIETRPARSLTGHIH